MTMHWRPREISEEDYEIEEWLDKILPIRMGSPDPRRYAKSQAEWDAYIEKIKAYALTCVDNPEKFADWDYVIEPLKPRDGRLAK